MEATNNLNALFHLKQFLNFLFLRNIKKKFGQLFFLCPEILFYKDIFRKNHVAGYSGEIVLFLLSILFLLLHQNFLLDLLPPLEIPSLSSEVFFSTINILFH